MLATISFFQRIKKIKNYVQFWKIKLFYYKIGFRSSRNLLCFCPRDVWVLWITIAIFFPKNLFGMQKIIF